MALSHPPSWHDRARTGCLVVVTSADQPALDLLLTAVRRRMPGTAFEFPLRMTTRRSGARDAELAVSRNLFRDIERDGGFLAHWEADGHHFGLPDSIRDLLVRGRSAVIAAPAEIVAELQEACPDVRVVHLTGELDAARAPLAPRACLRRIVGPRLAARLEARVTVPRTDAVSHAGDLPSAVRALTEALVRIEQESARHTPGAGAFPRLSRRRERSPVSPAAI